jgi:hypothetical protein
MAGNGTTHANRHILPGDGISPLSPFFVVKEGQMSKSQLKRDAFLKLVGAAGVALSAGASAFIPKRAAGADDLKIGVDE